MLYHLALAADWAVAVAAGEYRISTLGVTLEQEGFIHTSRLHQLRATADRFYAGVGAPLGSGAAPPARGRRLYDPSPRAKGIEGGGHGHAPFRRSRRTLGGVELSVNVGRFARTVCATKSGCRWA